MNDGPRTTRHAPLSHFCLLPFTFYLEIMSYPTLSLRESRWCSPLGPLRLWVSERGLALLDFDTDSDSDYSGWAQRYFGIAAPAAGSDDELLFAEAISQLAAYFAGQLRQFELPLDLRGTPFQLQVWQAVCAIP